ncbi:hypothetical protein BK124_30010 [Paenibacillus amylolyticus]|uniref:hypothetical protein n=1 Tax=Paenibacillus TaxID=44249 RepID=UPI00096F650C|nr:hypothetical protein [Paenibacillus amylolyticus]OME89933.1 hypothetical protein BK124_30010 [Paenibacillus amylolyticus]
MLINHKKKWITGFAIVLGLFAAYYFFIFNSYKSGIVDVDSTYISYDNADSLVSSAELVVIASPVADFDDREHDVTTYLTGAVQDFSTKTELRVENILKGDWNEEFLTVIEPVSYIQSLDGKQKITRDGYVEMQKGHTYIIALKKNTFGDYSIINRENGVFDLNDKISTPNSFSAEQNNTSDIISVEGENEELFEHERIKNEILDMFNM